MIYYFRIYIELNYFFICPYIMVTFKVSNFSCCLRNKIRKFFAFSKPRTIVIIIIIIIIIIGIQPLGRSGQRPELSQSTGMTLVRCILCKFLGVACHCFPPLFTCSHFSLPGASTSETSWEIPAAEVGTVGENVVR